MPNRFTHADESEIQRLQELAHDADDAVLAFVKAVGAGPMDWERFEALIEAAETAHREWIATRVQGPASSRGAAAGWNDVARPFSRAR